MGFSETHDDNGNRAPLYAERRLGVLMRQNFVAGLAAIPQAKFCKNSKVWPLLQLALRSKLLEGENFYE